MFVFILQNGLSGVEGAATTLQLRFETAVLEQKKLHTLACKGKMRHSNHVTKGFYLKGIG